jgi:hypothetical protein
MQQQIDGKIRENVSAAAADLNIRSPPPPM